MAELLIAASVPRAGSTTPDDLIEDDPFEQNVQSRAIKLKRAPGKISDVYSWFEITLQSIDVPSQTFTASIEVHLFWQDYNLPNLVPDFADEDFEIHDDYVPVKMSEIFENKKDISNSEPQFSYYPQTGTVYMFYVVQCTFVERMELQRFPFDRQFLNMSFNALIEPTVDGEGPWNWILEYPEWMPQELSSKFNQKFAVRMLSSITEYELLDPWVDFSGKQPLSIRLRVNRLPAYYFGNIVFPNFLIVAGSFSAFVIPRGEIADRLSVTVTLMLAAVAFRFIVSLMLPKVSYLTIMDYYLLLGFVAMILLIAENAIAGLPSLSEYASEIDTFSALFFAGVWAVVHVLAICGLVSTEFGRLSWSQMDKIDKAEDDEPEFVFAETQNVSGNAETELGKDEWDKYKKYDVLVRADIYAKANHIRRTGTFQKKLQTLRKRKASRANADDKEEPMLGSIYEEAMANEEKNMVKRKTEEEANAASKDNIDVFVPSKLGNKKKMEQEIELADAKAPTDQTGDSAAAGEEEVTAADYVAVDATEEADDTVGLIGQSEKEDAVVGNDVEEEAGAAQKEEYVEVNVDP